MTKCEVVELLFTGMEEDFNKIIYFQQILQGNFNLKFKLRTKLSLLKIVL